MIMDESVLEAQKRMYRTSIFAEGWGLYGETADEEPVDEAALPSMEVTAEQGASPTDVLSAGTGRTEEMQLSVDIEQSQTSDAVRGLLAELTADAEGKVNLTDVYKVIDRFVEKKISEAIGKPVLSNPQTAAVREPITGTSAQGDERPGQAAPQASITPDTPEGILWPTGSEVSESPVGPQLFSGADLPVGPQLFSGSDLPVGPQLFAGSDLPVGSPLFSSADLPVGPQLFSGADLPVGSQLFADSDVPVGSQLFAGSDLPVGLQLFSDADLPVGPQFSAGSASPIETKPLNESALPVGPQFSLGLASPVASVPLTASSPYPAYPAPEPQAEPKAPAALDTPPEPQFPAASDTLSEPQSPVVLDAPPEPQSPAASDALPEPQSPVVSNAPPEPQLSMNIPPGMREPLTPQEIAEKFAHISKQVEGRPSTSVPAEALESRINEFIEPSVHEKINQADAELQEKINRLFGSAETTANSKDSSAAPVSPPVPESRPISAPEPISASTPMPTSAPAMVETASLLHEKRDIAHPEPQESALKMTAWGAPAEAVVPKPVEPEWLAAQTGASVASPFSPQAKTTSASAASPFSPQAGTTGASVASPFSPQAGTTSVSAASPFSPQAGTTDPAQNLTSSDPPSSANQSQILGRAVPDATIAALPEKGADGSSAAIGMMPVSAFKTRETLPEEPFFKPIAPNGGVVSISPAKPETGTPTDIKESESEPLSKSELRKQRTLERKARAHLLKEHRKLAKEAQKSTERSFHLSTHSEANESSEQAAKRAEDEKLIILLLVVLVAIALPVGLLTNMGILNLEPYADLIHGVFGNIFGA